MRVKGKLKGNIVELPEDIYIENEIDVFVEIPEYNYSELDKKNLSEVIDIIWSKVQTNAVDDRDYREILKESLHDRYRDKEAQ